MRCRCRASCAPAPSADQKIPKVVSMTPTANFIVFSGTRASGARTATPTTADEHDRAAAPAAASGMLPCVLPKVRTMKATSSPSRKTPLNESVKPYQSIPARCRGAVVVPLELPREDRLLVVQRLEAACAQDRLAQPLQSEHQQQAADDEAQHIDRHERERRARARQ